MIPGTAVALYPLLKRYTPSAAIGYVALRIVEATIIVAGIVSVLSGGPGFCAGIGNGLLLGYMMFASGLPPRRLATFGMIAGSLAVVAATGVLFGAYEPQSAPQMLLTFPEMIWELTFGIYLIAKGFTAPARRRQTVAAAGTRTAALA